MKNYAKFQSAIDDADALRKTLAHVDTAIWFIETRKKTCPDAVKSLKKNRKFIQQCLDEAMNECQALRA